MSIKNSAFGNKDDNTGEDALRILMADDDPQEHILMTLASEGMSRPLSFDFVADGAKLLTELYLPTTVDELPNLIILDLRMPRLDGHRTLQELQAHPLFWQVPVIVMTSSARIEDEALSYARGAVLFQTKPTSFSGMEEFLERAIAIARPTSEYEVPGIPEPPIDITERLDVTDTPRKSIDISDERNWA